MRSPCFAMIAFVALVGPAFAQRGDDDHRADRGREWRDHDDGQGDRDRFRDRSSYSEDGDRRYERFGGRQRGSSFFLQSGNARIVVRCGDEALRSCIEAATTLMEKARQLPPPAEAPQGSPPQR